MPRFIHARAEHILAKNPDMDKGQAFAIATQQSHKLGKSPKGYGTVIGKQEAKAKYTGPAKRYERRANPGGLKTSKLAFVAFTDEITKIAETKLKPRRVGGAPRTNIDTRTLNEPTDQEYGDELEEVKTSAQFLSPAWGKFMQGPAAKAMRKFPALHKPGMAADRAVSGVLGADRKISQRMGLVSKPVVKSTSSVVPQSDLPPHILAAMQRTKVSSSWAGWDEGDSDMGSLKFKQESHLPPFRRPKLKTAFSKSQYSGPLGTGRFPQASSLPPFRNPPLRKFGGPEPKGKVKESVSNEWVTSRVIQAVRSGDISPGRLKEFISRMSGDVKPFHKYLASAVGGNFKIPAQRAWNKKHPSYATRVKKHGTKGSGSFVKLVRKNGKTRYVDLEKYAYDPSPLSNVHLPGMRKMKTPAIGLQSSKNVAQIKETPPGPSIAQIAKPRGYGAPAAGAIKF